MDTSRKTLTDRNTCNFCIHYQQMISSSGKKLCRGKCRVTGTYKQRTNYKCKKNFQDNGQMKLSIEQENKEDNIEEIKGNQLEIDDFLKDEDKSSLKPYQLSFIEL